MSPLSNVKKGYDYKPPPLPSYSPTITTPIPHHQHLTSDLNMPSISCSVPVSHQEHKKVNMKVEPGEYVQMTCNPDITMIDIIPNLKGLEIGDIKVFSRLNFPVPVDPLQT